MTNLSQIEEATIQYIRIVNILLRFVQDFFGVDFGFGGK